MTDTPPPGPPPAGFGLPDENHNVQIIAGTAVTTFIALVFIVLRFWIRIRIIQSVGSDDYWILAAFLLSIIGWAIVVPSVFYGAGRHMFYILQDIGREGLITGLKLNFATQFLYVFSLACVKISIGLFLVRLTPAGKYRTAVYGVCCFVAFYTLAGSGALLATCRPFAANFDRSIPGTKCYTAETSRALAYTNSSLGIATDFIFATLPIPLLWRLKINKRVKVSIIGILSLGLFVASTSIVKLYYLTGYGVFGDFLWDSTYLTIWSVTEANVGIIVASIPALKPLFKTILGSTYGNAYGAYPSRKNGYAQHSRGANDNLSSNISRSRNRRGPMEEFELHGSSTSTGVVSGAERERNKLGVYNVSEESILPLQSNIGQDGKGIVKTTHVSVKTHDADTPRNIEDRV